jgi:hypothetical protein
MAVPAFTACQVNKIELGSHYLTLLPTLRPLQALIMSNNEDTDGKRAHDIRREGSYTHLLKDKLENCMAAAAIDVHLGVADSSVPVSTGNKLKYTFLILDLKHETSMETLKV